MYSLSDFDFHLPPERIAQFPLPDRSASRLLHVDGKTLHDRQFTDILDQLQAGDLLVMNNTRVLKARFFGVKDSGGKVEALVERVLDTRTVLAQVRASKSPGPGVKIRLADAFDVTVGERAGEFYTLHFDADVFDLIEQYGRLPLPPYIEHAPGEVDETRYQTVFNKVPGAVAALSTLPRARSRAAASSNPTWLKRESAFRTCDSSWIGRRRSPFEATFANALSGRRERCLPVSWGMVG